MIQHGDKVSLGVGITTFAEIIAPYQAKIDSLEKERQQLLDNLTSIRKDYTQALDTIENLNTRIKQLEEELSFLNAAFDVREVLSSFEEATVQHLQKSFQFRSKAKQLGNILHLLTPDQRSNVEELINVLQKRLHANNFAHSRPQESPTDVLNRWYSEAENSFEDEATKTWFQALFPQVLQAAITISTNNKQAYDAKVVRLKQNSNLTQVLAMLFAVTAVSLLPLLQECKEDFSGDDGVYTITRTLKKQLLLPTVT